MWNRKGYSTEERLKDLKSLGKFINNKENKEYNMKIEIDVDDNMIVNVYVRHEIFTIVRLKDIPEELHEKLILFSGNISLDLEYAFIIKSDDDSFIYKTILSLDEIKEYAEILIKFNRTGIFKESHNYYVYGTDDTKWYEFQLFD